MWYVTFRTHFTQHVLTSVCLVASISTSFFFKNCSEWCFIICLYHNLFIHSLGCFHLLSIVDSAAMNIYLQGFWVPVLLSFGCIPRSGITVTYANSGFNFLGTIKTIFIHTHFHIIVIVLCIFLCVISDIKITPSN